MHPPEGPGAKILSLDRLLAERQAMRNRGQSLVQCHGCFDIVHPGHVRHLQHAASLGQRLLVSITADGHVDKGDGRPLFNEQLRAENLAALGCVHWVYINPEPTADGLLEQVRPDVYVKGREYEDNDDPRFARERAAVERHGGRVVFSSGDVVFSSTALVEAVGREGIADGDEDPALAGLRRLASKYDLTPAAVHATLDGMRDRRVVVIGETILDTYVRCAWPEVTGEAPMLSLRPIGETTYDGGAAIIARHCAALGARATLVSPLGEGPAGKALRGRLDAAGVNMGEIPLPGPPPEKQRFMVGRDKLVKLDRVRSMELDARARERLIAIVAEAAEGADAAILADYGLGLLSPRLLEDLSEQLRPRVHVLSGDVSGRRASLVSMRDADWLSPSEAELRHAVGDYDSSLPAVAWELARRTNARNIVVTLGLEGLVAFRRSELADLREGWPSRLIGEPVPALGPPAVDPLGCGDALLAAGTLAMCAGATPVVASFIGSLAAAAEAARIGNAPIGTDAVIATMHQLATSRPVARTLSGDLRLVS